MVTQIIVQRDRQQLCIHVNGYGPDGETVWKVELAKTLESATNCSSGVHMCCKNAALCHLPKVWIMESSTPAVAMVVAAPIRKLWPAQSNCGRPRSCRIERIHVGVWTMPLWVEEEWAWLANKIVITPAKRPLPLALCTCSWQSTPCHPYVPLPLYLDKHCWWTNTLTHPSLSPVCWFVECR